MTQKIDGYNSSQPLTTTGTKNVAGVGKASLDKSASPAVGSAADHVTLTDSAKSFQKIEEALANAPVVDSGKVASAKLAIGNGTYKVDSGRVADKILKFEKNL